VHPILFLHPKVDLSQGGFTLHWSTVIGLLALWGLYEWRAAVHARTDGRRPTALQRLCLLLGLGAMFGTLNGPVHDISDYYLFTGHMVQHLVLTFVTPPLLLLGVPGWMLRPALAQRHVAAVARAVTTPRAAFAIFNLTLAFWHLPPNYNSAMYYHEVHILQHLMFLVTAVLAWWPLLSPLPELPRLSYPGPDALQFPHDPADDSHIDLHRLLGSCALPGLRQRAAALGTLAARGPAARRSDHVDPRRAVLLPPHVGDLPEVGAVPAR
jgi:hypothetical protein